MIFSNRKLRMIIIIILLVIFCYFIGIYKPKALAVTDFTYIQAFNSNNGCTKQGSTSSGREVSTSLYGTNGCTLNWTNFGSANYLVVPIFVYTSENENLDTTNSFYGGVYDKSTQIILITDVGNVYCDYDGTYATCPWKVAGATNLSNINFITTKGGGITIGYYVRVANGWWTADTSASANNSIANNTNDIKNSINDSSIDDSSSSTSGFSNTTNSIMSNSPVSNLIALPITFLTGVNNAISSSCTNVNYIELFNYQLVLPCLNLSDRLGSVWVIIDTIVSCMLLFSIGKSLVSTFARLSDMDTNIMYECYANGKDHRGESF